MVDLARERVHQFNRKRKPDGDDCQDHSSSDSIVSPESILVDVPNAPRQLTANDVWPSSSSDPPVSQPTYSSRSAKRPRIDTTSLSTRSPLRRSPRRHHSSKPDHFPRASRRSRRTGDICETGAVNPATTASLLRFPPTSSRHNHALPLVPIDPNSPHIPSLHPLVNRQTLKELDLDSILRNPQLRHDLLFDAGLQFRPTSSRRKREMSENYWLSITRELETGCTCVSFDLHGKPHELVCACGQVPLPSVNPILAFSSSLSVLTLRMPSRIRPLLSEFLEVLLSVLTPLASISGMYVNPNTFQSQMQEHAAQAAYIRAVFDPELIDQELKHELFDPSSLFRSIGLTLKSHCAPMRDGAVEEMVTLAETCAPGGSGTKSDAVKALKYCMDILELMKLDIANHQLQTLRPFLVRTSGQFELKAFQARKDRGVSLQLTQEWLRAAHRSMLECHHPIPHPSNPLNYHSLHRTQQTYISVLRAMTNLVFKPPSSLSLTSPTTPISPNPLAAIPALPGYPETTYLDSARLLVLSADAMAATALYMFLLLYRQLICSGGHVAPKVDESDLAQLKKEIRDIGTSHLGHCFALGCSEKGSFVDEIDSFGADRKDWHKARTIRQDIVLQIAMRAHEAQQRTNSHPAPSSLPSRPAPDEHMLKLAERWADSNMQLGSPLSDMLRDRLRDATFKVVVSTAYPPRDASTGKISAIDFSSARHTLSGSESLGTSTGMEPLMDEIKSLGERLAKLILIHLNAYLPLYEQEQCVFLES